MSKIKTIVFDLGGVIFKIDKYQAIDRFKEIGFDQAEQYLDAYEQQGIFGDVEAGRISAEEFRSLLSEMSNKEFSMEQCLYAWQGYFVSMPRRNLETVMQLRDEGYRVCLLSNTNPFMMAWARSNDFDGYGNPLDHYFDALYLSYEMKVMKPSREIFEMMLEAEKASPDATLFIDDSPSNVAAAASLGIHILQPENGADWVEELYGTLETIC